MLTERVTFSPQIDSMSLFRFSRMLWKTWKAQQSASKAGHTGIFFTMSLTWESAVSHLRVLGVTELHAFCSVGKRQEKLFILWFPGSLFVFEYLGTGIPYLSVCVCWGFLVVEFNSCLSTYAPPIKWVPHILGLWLCSTFYFNTLLGFLSSFLKSFLNLSYGQNLLVQEICFDLSIFSSISAEMVLISMKSEEKFTLTFISRLLGTRSQELKFVWSTDTWFQCIFCHLQGREMVSRIFGGSTRASNCSSTRTRSKSKAILSMLPVIWHMGKDPCFKPSMTKKQ